MKKDKVQYQASNGAIYKSLGQLRNNDMVSSYCIMIVTSGTSVTRTPVDTMTGEAIGETRNA